MASRDYFKGKRIAVIGLGAHGEMVEDVKYLIKAGAWVSIYDLKSEARLKNHLVFLRSIGLANYVCGSIPEEDLIDMDLIILSHEYPKDSSFLKAARSQTDRAVPIEYPETLFFKLAPPVTLVGVMGPCGKSTVISMLAPMLEKVCDEYETQGFFVIDPDSGDGVLSHIKKIKSGDIVLMRIVENIMHELYAMRISPHVAIFTGMPSRVAYTTSPLEIVSYQTYNNFIVASDEIIDATRAMKLQPKSKMLRTKSASVPADWGFVGRGLHDRSNASLALQAARLFKVEDDDARHVLSTWKALKGRLDMVKKIKNVEFYNDTMSTTPDATLAGISALSAGRNLILIFGGSDTGLEYRMLYSELPRHVHTVVSIPGSGTLRQRAPLQEIEGITVYAAPTIEEAVRIAAEQAIKGDKVLFSPGFTAGGIDGSKKERGDIFVKTVRGL